MASGEAIRKFRQKKKLTQKELGNALGVSAQMIAQYETGKRNPKFETLARIAMALNVSIFDLSPSELSCSDIDFSYGKIRMNIDGHNIYVEPLTYQKAINDLIQECHPNQLSGLIDRYFRLNTLGKNELFKRAHELLRLKEYTKPDSPESAGSDASPLMSDQTAAGAPEDGDPAAEPNNDNSINPDKP